MSGDILILFGIYLRIWIHVEFSTEIIFLHIHYFQAFSAKKSDTILIPEVLYESYFFLPWKFLSFLYNFTILKCHCYVPLSGSFFVCCAAHLASPVNMETYSFQLWDIFLSYFFNYFFPSFCSAVSYENPNSDTGPHKPAPFVFLIPLLHFHVPLLHFLADSPSFIFCLAFQTSIT